MKRIRLLVLFLAVCGLFLAAADKKEITVAAGETRSSAINAFNARLDVRGRVDESVFLLGGSLRLEGEVTGDVICVAADVEIADGSVIGRDLIVIGGRLRKADNSRVGGRVYDVRSREGMRRVAASVMPLVPEEGGMTFFKVVKIFFWLLLSLLALAVFPVPVAQAAAMLPREPLRHAGRGLLTLLLFVLLTLVFLLLSFVLIGIPLLVVLLAAFFLLLIFGRAAVFYCIGERLCRFFKLQAGPTLFIVLGIAIYTLFKFIPYAGGVLLVAIDLLAVGVGVGYFLRRRKSLA
ncbi:MAG: hypothetical protein PHX05_00315 [Acidobacteriota bacterium]|nr:hypothetical protein [Acidobacteriota bacterium]